MLFLLGFKKGYLRLSLCNCIALVVDLVVNIAFLFRGVAFTL